MKLSPSQQTYDKSEVCEEDPDVAILIVVQADASVPRVVHVRPGEADKTKTWTEETG